MLTSCCSVFSFAFRPNLRSYPHLLFIRHVAVECTEARPSLRHELCLYSTDLVSFWGWRLPGSLDNFDRHYRRHPVKFCDASYIALPVNVNGNHWFLCIIVNSTPSTPSAPDSLPQFNVIVLDSLRGSRDVILAEITAMLRYMIGTEYNLDASSLPIPVHQPQVRLYFPLWYTQSNVLPLSRCHSNPIIATVGFTLRIFFNSFSRIPQASYLIAW